MREFYKLTLVDIKGGDISAVPAESRVHYFEEQKSAESVVATYAKHSGPVEFVWETETIQSLTHEETIKVFDAPVITPKAENKRRGPNQTPAKKKRK